MFKENSVFLAVRVSGGELARPLTAVHFHANEGWKAGVSSYALEQLLRRHLFQRHDLCPQNYSCMEEAHFDEANGLVCYNVKLLLRSSQKMKRYGWLAQFFTLKALCSKGLWAVNAVTYRLHCEKLFMLQYKCI